MTLAAIYLSRVGVIGSAFAAALAVWAVVLPPAVAALNIGVGPCWGKTFIDMLEAMARIASSQPNEAMARIAPRCPRAPMVKKKNSLDPSCRVKIPENFFRT